MLGLWSKQELQTSCCSDQHVVDLLPCKFLMKRTEIQTRHLSLGIELRGQEHSATHTSSTDLLLTTPPFEVCSGYSSLPEAVKLLRLRNNWCELLLILQMLFSCLHSLSFQKVPFLPRPEKQFRIQK